MRVKHTMRGFGAVEHQLYPSGEDGYLLQESSAIDSAHQDAFDKPGSSYLWVGIGGSFHLSRDEVEELIGYLKRWLKTGRLSRERKKRNA